MNAHARPPSIRAAFDMFPDEIVVDNFAGGGGATTGIEDAIGRHVDIAINHDPEAIAMHMINHPKTEHVLGSVWDADPRALCKGRRVGLAWFSPDCTFFSKSRGGKPFRDRRNARGRRGLAWVAVRWIKVVAPRICCIENVEEFKDWGPLDESGKPCPKRRGASFRKWLSAFRAEGYAVEWRELRACDYGAPTIRKRLFIIARNDGRPIVWPQPTHGPRTSAPYRTAAECIDWSLKCPSIFERPKPLAAKTLARIARGIRRFVLENADPFIVTTTHGRVNDARPYSMHEPIKTITGAHRGELAIVAPVVTKYHGGEGSNGRRAQGVDEPLRTIDTANRFALLGATLIQTGYGERPGQAPRVPGLGKPLGTVVGDQKHAVVAAFLAKHYGGHESSSGGTHVADPFATVTARDHHAFVAATMIQLKGDGPRGGRDLLEPAPTICAKGTHLAEVCAFLARFEGAAPEVAQLEIGEQPRPRLGLVRIGGVLYEIVDIGMRMLAPRELFRAQSFGDHYVIDPVVERTWTTRRGRVTVRRARLTKTAQVRMCGNSVPPMLAAAIVSANVQPAAIAA